MTAEHRPLTTQLIGQRGNPLPAKGKKYEVEIIDQVGGEVCVRYVDPKSEVDPWWITETAWFAWKKYEDERG